MFPCLIHNGLSLFPLKPPKRPPLLPCLSLHVMSPALNPHQTHFTSSLRSPSLYNLPARRSLYLAIQIRCNQGSTKQNPKKKIVLFGEAPPVLDERDRRISPGNGGATPSPSPSSYSPSAWRFLKAAPKRALALLSNLPLAIAEMAAIGSLMALGTIRLTNLNAIGD